MERWSAVRRLDNSFTAERWLVPTGVGTIIVLTVMLIVVTWRRAIRQRRMSRKLFLAYGAKLGLTQRECQILHDIAVRARLQQDESIFTMDTAFEQGATRNDSGPKRVSGQRQNEPSGQRHFA
jgi:hypothetical protein